MSQHTSNTQLSTSAVPCLVAQPCPSLGSPVDCAPPGSSVHGFSRQEYWSGLPGPPPGDLPNPGMEPRSPALQTDSSPAEPPGKTLLRHGSFFLNWFTDSMQSQINSSRFLKIEMDKLLLKCIWEKTQENQSNFERREQSWSANTT